MHGRYRNALACAIPFPRHRSFTISCPSFVRICLVSALYHLEKKNIFTFFVPIQLPGCRVLERRRCCVAVVADGSPPLNVFTMFEWLSERHHVSFVSIFSFMGFTA